MAAKVFVLLVLALATTDAQGINLAINKSVYYCSITKLPDTITDGNKQISRPSIDASPCPPIPFLHVELGPSVFVNYVVFYTGVVEPGKCAYDFDSMLRRLTC